MSRGDAWSVAVTLIVTGIAYFATGAKTAIACLIIGGFIAMGLRFARSKERPSKKEDTNKELAVKDSFNQAQSQYTGAVTQQVFIGQDNKPQQPEREEIEETAKIDFIQRKLVLLHENGYAIWHEAVSNLESAIPAVVVEFKNKPKPVGQRTVKASSVTASLVYRGKGNPEELHVSHGTWLSEYTHFASFGSGKVHQLIVAMKLGNPFVALENKRSNSPFTARFTSGRTIHHAQPVVLPAATGELEITLVDMWGVTVYHGLFDYDCSSADRANLREKSGKHT